MCDSSETVESSYNSPQCQHFVIRKKRLCRMTVKPGKHYCGEHEPRPKTGDGQDDTRIPCPNDPKHTCYASKLEKHLSICNARQRKQPPYIVHNVNAPAAVDNHPRLPLAKVPLKKILQVIDKVNALYDTYLKDKIRTLVEQPIHKSVLPEFSECGRAESSLRHLRQASSLLHAVEGEGLVADDTAYVELGAGKGHLSYYAWWAWCQGTGSRVVLVDRASLRHKRDNKLRAAPHDSGNLNGNDRLDGDNNRDNGEEMNINGDECASHVQRVRADLAHLVLGRVPAVRASGGVVGYAKHLCGAATDLALRCITAGGVQARVRGAALASCCHHRCERAAYPANALLLKLGVDADDFNTLLGLVSWATCGDGRSRDRRNQGRNGAQSHADDPDRNNTEPHDDNADRGNENTTRNTHTSYPEEVNSRNVTCHLAEESEELGTKNITLSREQRAAVGRRAKALLDWGRVLYLAEHGFDARLVHYVPTAVSLENVCILARKRT